MNCQLFWLIVLHYIVKKLDIKENMSNKMVQINIYTDDVVVLSRTLEALEETLQEVDILHKK